MGKNHKLKKKNQKTLPKYKTIFYNQKQHMEKQCENLGAKSPTSNDQRQLELNYNYKTIIIKL